MLYDVFLFNKEFDVLEWRLHELQDVVDRFVLVEARQTFQGTPKPAYFSESKFLDFPLARIKVVAVDLPGEVNHPQEREDAQRNAALLGLLGATDNDLIMLSDVDEIPSADAVEVAKRRCKHGVMFEQELFHYWLNCRNITEPFWFGTRMAPLSVVRAFTPAKFRVQRFPIVNNGGWHFSSLGGAEAMLDKLASWSHDAWNRYPYNTLEHQQHAIETATDWDTERNMKMMFVPLTDNYPRYLLDNIDKYSKYVRREGVTA